MAIKKRVRKAGFVGLNLAGKDGDLSLLVKLDAKVAETMTNRSHIVRQALLEYLK